MFLVRKFFMGSLFETLAFISCVWTLMWFSSRIEEP